MRIDQIITTQGVPSSFSAQKATGEEFGGQIAQSMLRAGEALENVSDNARYMGRLEAAAQKKKQKLDNSNKALKYAEDAETEFTKVKNELLGLPSDQIEQRFGQERERIQKKFSTLAQQDNEEVSAMFTHHFLNISGKYERHALDTKQQKWLDESKEHLDRALDYVMDQAAKASPVDRPTWVQAGTSRIDWYAREGLIPQVQADKMKQALVSGIKLQSVENDALTDPVGTLKKYQLGLYGEMTVSEKIKSENFIRTALAHNVTEEDRAQKQREKDFKENERKLKSNLMTMVMKGQNVTSVTEQLLEMGSVEGDTGKWVLDFQREWITRLGEDSVVEDENIKGDLVKRAYSGDRPTLTDQELYDAWKNKKIKTSTFTSIQAHLTSRRDQLRREAEGDAKEARNQSYRNATQSLALFFEVEGPMAQMVDRDIKELHSTALTEIYGLVYNDGKSPEKALNILKNRYGRVINSKKATNAKTLRNSLPIPSSEKLGSIGAISHYLDMNKGKMDSATWNSAVSVLRRIDAIESSKLEKEQEIINLPKESDE